MAVEQLVGTGERTASVDTQYVLERIDAIMRELQELRHMMEPVARQDSPLKEEQDLVDLLWGSLGQGSWDELDSTVDTNWYRFDAPLD